jgi:hypothetical protein
LCAKSRTFTACPPIEPDMSARIIASLALLLSACGRGTFDEGGHMAAADAAAPAPDEGADVDAGTEPSEPARISAPGPVPVDVVQRCDVWQDCGPNYDDLNSGFECQASTCTCDPDGTWAPRCAEAGASWNPAECLCVFSSEPMPTILATPPSSSRRRDDDVVCWWHFRDTGCAPDRFVDQAHIERQCARGVCRNVWVQDGYWVDGECSGRWVIRCSDGYEY